MFWLVYCIFVQLIFQEDIVHLVDYLTELISHLQIFLEEISLNFTMMEDVMMLLTVIHHLKMKQLNK